LTPAARYGTLRGLGKDARAETSAASTRAFDITNAEKKRMPDSREAERWEADAPAADI